MGAKAPAYVHALTTHVPLCFRLAADFGDPEKIGRSEGRDGGQCRIGAGEGGEVGAAGGQDGQFAAAGDVKYLQQWGANVH